METRSRLVLGLPLLPSPTVLNTRGRYRIVSATVDGRGDGEGHTVRGVVLSEVGQRLKKYCSGLPVVTGLVSAPLPGPLSKV